MEKQTGVRKSNATQRVDEGLRESVTLDSALLANVPMGIYRSNAEVYLLRANPTLSIMFGYDADEQAAHKTIGGLTAYAIRNAQNTPQ